MGDGLRVGLQVDMCFLPCGVGYSLARAEMGLPEAYCLERGLQLPGSMSGIASLSICCCNRKRKSFNIWAHHVPNVYLISISSHLKILLFLPQNMAFHSLYYFLCCSLFGKTLFMTTKLLTTLENPACMSQIL